MNDLITNINMLHTTAMGAQRVKKNLSVDTDPVQWCKTKILSDGAVIEKNGKNWYIVIDDCRITVNSYSYTIITAHKINR